MKWHEIIESNGIERNNHIEKSKNDIWNSDYQSSEMKWKERSLYHLSTSAAVASKSSLAKVIFLLAKERR